MHPVRRAPLTRSEGPFARCVRHAESVHLELREHSDLQPHQTPYAPNLDFAESWWDETERWTNPGVHALYFLLEGVEVARARVIENAPIELFWRDFNPRLQTLEIDWFEVASVLPPRSGVGRAAVWRIREAWPDSQVVARSRVKDYFWGGRDMGFLKTSRSDGAERTNPLFVAPPLA